jgi:arylsulfatase A-like enzyme
MNRRDFLAQSAAPLLLAQTPEIERPNILWVTCEDMSPTIGCYGDKLAITPAIDALAQRGLRFRHVWSNAPVCAPARTTIISGMYPPSTGAENMRSTAKLAPGQKMFPQILKEAGYYTTNNVKEDYNLEYTGGSQAAVWSESSRAAHWRKRAPGQPFFSVFNHEITHESQIRKTPHQLKHDPREVRVPAYHPDTPETRHDWAQYYDNITTMDTQIGKILADLEADGLKDSTIVFFYSDHGAGMPRSKRWPYNSGLQVPMIVHIPAKFAALAPADYKPGEWCDRLVSFVDLAPTVLNLAGIAAEPYHQGQAFLGAQIPPPRDFVFGFRGRMDERIDMVRSVRTKRYVYIRNYMPHRIYGQHVDYMFEMPTTRKWKEVFDSGKATEAQSHFWKTKPAEELYDLENDPDEIKNLAERPTSQQLSQLRRMRTAQQTLANQICDVGFLPEHEMRERSKPDAPYVMGHNPKRYNVARIIAAAEIATGPRLPEPDLLRTYLADSDSAIRYWTVIGILRQGEAAVKETLPELRALLKDTAPNPMILAAEALARYGEPTDLAPAMEMLIAAADVTRTGNYVAIAAMNSLTEIGAAKLKPYHTKLIALPKDSPATLPRERTYVARLVEYLSALAA